MKIVINGRNIGSTQSPGKLPPWSRLHLERNPTEEFFADWKRYIPSQGCTCASNFSEIEEELPPDFTSPEAFFARGIEWHNRVNRKLDYQEITLNQALMLWRHQRPKTGRTRCVVTVATGKAFRDLLDFTRPYLRSYAMRNDADYIELTNQTELWWGFEKFRTLFFSEQYEETLFIDADCVIRPDAPSLFGTDAGIMIHDDWKYLAETSWLRSQREIVGKGLGVEFEQRDTCLNSGVVYCKQSHAGVWSQPSRTMNTNHTSEQLYVEQSAFRLGYEELDSRMNWQFYFPGFWQGVKDAYLVHFATSNEKLNHAKRTVQIWRDGGLL